MAIVRTIGKNTIGDNNKMKVRLLGDGGYGDLLTHIKFPVVVRAEPYVNSDVISVKDEELLVTCQDGYLFFNSHEYEVI